MIMPVRHVTWVSNVIDAEMEREYNNRAAVIDHADYMQSWARRSEDYRQSARAFLNVSYGSHPRQLLDIFPATSEPAPVHVFIHGGYWQALNKDSFSFMAEAFNKSNECAVILNYGLCPDLSIAQIIDQVQQAMLWLMQHIREYGGDAKNMTVTGHSAGAHLAASMMTLDWSQAGCKVSPFQQVNALSGLYDLAPLIHTRINQALALEPAVIRDISPLFNRPWRPAASQKLQLWVGGLESRQYRMQSENLQQSWQHALDVGYELLPVTHHFSILDAFVSAR